MVCLVKHVFRFDLLGPVKLANWLGVEVLCRRGGPPHSPSRIAAKEGIEHGLFQALLVLPTPGDHCPIAAGRVQMVAVTGKRKAHDGLV